MPNWAKIILLGVGTFISTTLATILDEIMKLAESQALTEVSDKSLAIAIIFGVLSAFAVWKAYVTPSPKE